MKTAATSAMILGNIRQGDPVVGGRAWSKQGWIEKVIVSEISDQGLSQPSK
jgi:hypothetical protein